MAPLSGWGHYAFNCCWAYDRDDVGWHGHDAVKRPKAKSDEINKAKAAKARCLVFEMFKGDFKRASLWFTTPNVHFGDITPSYLIKIGRAHKVLEFVLSCKQEQTREQAPT